MIVLTKEERRVIRERCDRATPGPWVHGYSGDPEDDPDTEHGVVAFGQGGICEMDSPESRTQGIRQKGGPERPARTRADQIANGAFIGCARFDIPALLDTIDVLERRIAILRGVETGKVELWHGVRSIVRRVGRETIHYDAIDGEEGVTIMVVDDQFAEGGPHDPDF